VHQSDDEKEDLKSAKKGEKKLLSGGYGTLYKTENK
jgi:hypothetical protein